MQALEEAAKDDSVITVVTGITFDGCLSQSVHNGGKIIPSTHVGDRNENSAEWKNAKRDSVSLASFQAAHTATAPLKLQNKWHLQALNRQTVPGVINSPDSDVPEVYLGVGKRGNFPDIKLRRVLELPPSPWNLHPANTSMPRSPK